MKVILLNPDDTKFNDSGLVGLVDDAKRIKVPLAAIAVSDDELLYMQFRSDCEERFEMAKRVLSLRFTSDMFRIEHQVVIPGPSTINVFGESWSDGEMDWPPPTR